MGVSPGVDLNGDGGNELSFTGSMVSTTDVPPSAHTFSISIRASEAVEFLLFEADGTVAVPLLPGESFEIAEAAGVWSQPLNGALGFSLNQHTRTGEFSRGPVDGWSDDGLYLVGFRYTQDGNPGYRYGWIELYNRPVDPDPPSPEGPIFLLPRVSAVYADSGSDEAIHIVAIPEPHAIGIVLLAFAAVISSRRFR